MFCILPSWLKTHSRTLYECPIKQYTMLLNVLIVVYCLLILRITNIVNNNFHKYVIERWAWRQIHLTNPIRLLLCLLSTCWTLMNIILCTSHSHRKKAHNGSRLILAKFPLFIVAWLCCCSQTGRLHIQTWGPTPNWRPLHTVIDTALKTTENDIKRINMIYIYYIIIYIYN